MRPMPHRRRASGRVVIGPAQAPFLDAVALINAQQRRDGHAVSRILDDAELDDLVIVKTLEAANDADGGDW